MKIGELYYGISIPQSEFRRVEQQLKRFEQAMKQAGGREARESLRDTAQAATEAGVRLTELTRSWTVLNEKYVAGKIGSQEFVEMSRSIVNQLGSEMDMLDSTSQEYANFAAMKTRVSRTEQAENNRISKTVREQAIARDQVTFANGRYAESSRLLISDLNREAAQLARIDASQKAGNITKAQALQQYELLRRALQELRTRFEGANVAADQQTQAFKRIDSAISTTSNRIERLKLQTQGYNTQTLEGVKLSDSLTKAWLIGLGPQGYRLYLVMSVLKDTVFGLNTSIKGTIGLLGKLGVILKASGIGALLTALGASIAGLNQMLQIEDTMADVRKTTGLTTRELEGLEQAFRSLSLEIPSTVNELAEIATQAGQLGVRGQRNIFEFTRAIAELNLAVTGLGADAAITMGRFLNVIGTPIMEFGDRAREIAGILNELENNTAATAGEILDMARNLAFLNAIAGVSMRDILGMSAGLKAMGVNAELAGTNARKVFFTLVKDIATGNKAVDRWAAAAGMVRDEFVELARSENGFSKALTRVALNLGRAQLGAEEMTAAISNLGFTNQREIQVVLALAQGHRAFQQAMELANDETQTAVSIQDELAIRLEVTRVRLQLVRNRFAAMVQVIGMELLPMLGDSVLWFERNSEALGHYGAGLLAVVDLIKGVAQFALGMAKFIASPFIAVFWYIEETMKIANTLLEPLRALNAVFDDENRSTADVLRGAVDAYQALRGVRDMLQPYGSNLLGGPIMGGIVKERIDEMFRGIQDDNWAGALESFTSALTNWNDRAERISGRMPELIDMVDELYARAAMFGDIDSDLLSMLDEEKAKKAGRTVQDVVSNLGAALIAIKEYGAYMESQGLKYDVPLEQNNAMIAALRELVFTFGQTAKSPEAAGVIAMLEELGVNAQEAMKLWRDYEEWLTKNWLRKLEFFVEIKAMTPEQALHQVTTAAIRLREKLMVLSNPPEGVARDWEAIWSLEARIRDAERFRDALSQIVVPPLTPQTASYAETMQSPPLVDTGWLERYKAAAEESASVTEEWGKATQRTLSPLEALYDRLQKLSNVPFASIASGAAGMLDQFAETFFPQLFTQETEKAIETLPQKLQRLSDGLQVLAERQAEVTRVTTEAQNPLGHLYYYMLDVAAGTDEAALAAQNLLAWYRELFHELEGRAPIAGLGDAVLIGDANPLAIGDSAGIQDTLDLMLNSFNTVFRAAQTPVVELRNLLLTLANSDIPQVAAMAKGYLAWFETDFPASFDNLSERAKMLSRVMAGTFPPGMLKPFEMELKELGEEIQLREQQLENAVDLYTENSTQVAELQATIAGLRAEIVRLTDAQSKELELQKRINDELAASMAARAEQMSMLESAIRAITQATAPQLTQTQTLIQQYEEMLPLLGRLAPMLLPFINLLKEKDAREGAEALADATERVAALMGNGRTAIQSYILDLENLKGVYPDLADAIDALIAKLREFEAMQVGDDPLKKFREQLDSLQGKTRNPFTKLIEDMRAAQGVGDEFNQELADMIDLAVDLGDKFDRAMKMQEFVNNLQLALDVAGQLIDLMQDGNWTDGNKLLDAAIGIGAALANLIPVIGPAVSQAISIVGDFLKSTLGDLANGAKEVARAIEETAQRSKFIGPELAESLTITERVSRGGILGWLGFTKEAIVAELTEMNIAIAESIGGAMSTGIMNALRGRENWRDELRKSIKESIAQGIIEAFIAESLMSMGLADFVKEFNRILRSDGAQSAADYAKENINEILDSVEEQMDIISDAMRETGLVIADEMQALADSIASSLTNAFANSIKNGITAALRGEQDWKRQLHDGLKSAVMDALMNAFVDAMVVQAGMGEFIEEFTRILREDGVEAAAKFARGNMQGVIAELQEGAEVIARELMESGLWGPSPVSTQDEFDSSAPQMFSLPTATPGIITATPAWVDNLGMHFSKFGMYVDRLVDEGITVMVVNEQGQSMSARDFRLGR